MYYEFNISQNGRHVLATAPRSGEITKEEAYSMYLLLNQKFSEKDGYKLLCTQRFDIGKEVDFQTVSSFD